MEEFKAITDITKQCKAASLKKITFRNTQATLETAKTDANLREVMAKGCMPLLKQVF